MCGIAGYFGESEFSSKFLDESIICLSHRGPDGKGKYDLKWAGLSHTRLALFAPGLAGKQPFIGKKFAISFNGEIYNWRELAFELSKQGIRQFSNSDTETLLNCIENWGIKKTLENIRGIFVIAALDLLTESLLIIRDSAGTKPIYFTNYFGTTYFASEIKAFRRFGLQIDSDGLKEYLTFQNFFTQKTLFKNVYLAPAGAICEFKKGVSEPQITIWDPGIFTSNLEISEEEALEKLDFLLNQSVGRNLNSDFKVGGFLSGGIDSSMLAMAINSQKQGIDFFTLGFDNKNATILEMNFDERSAATKFANQFNLRHHISEIGPGSLEKIFDQLCWSIEEPRVGQSYPNLFASIEAKKHVKACISGAGGDELFGGYPWRYQEVLEKSQFGKNFQLDAYLKVWHRLGSMRDIAELTRDTFTEHKYKATEGIKSVLNVNSTDSKRYNLEDLLYFEYKTFLHGLLLIEDKISMSQGLEIRVPFLDQDLVQFAQTLPNHLRVSKLSHKFNKVNENKLDSIPKRNNNGKIILRLLAESWSNPLSRLPKQGFSGPDASWFRNESSNFVKSRLVNKSSPIWENINYDAAMKMVDSHLEGKENRRLLIWSLLSLDSIYRQFL